MPEALNAEKLVSSVIDEQGARYSSFLTNFDRGFGDTELEMYKCILYPVVTADIKKLEAGLSYRELRTSIEKMHPQVNNLNPGNLTKALYSAHCRRRKISSRLYWIMIEVIFGSVSSIRDF